MVKLRLKRYGRKQQPSYRIIAIDAKSRREGKALKEVGLYDPIRERSHLDIASILSLLEQGAQPSRTVSHIFKKAGILKDKLSEGIL